MTGYKPVERPLGAAVTFHEYVWQKLLLLRALLTGGIVLPL